MKSSGSDIRRVDVWWHRWPRYLARSLAHVSHETSVSHNRIHDCGAEALVGQGVVEGGWRTSGKEELGSRGGQV